MLKLTSILERLLDLSSTQIRRLAPFFLLAVTLKISDLVADTLATSLFLTYAGAKYLPLAYIFLGVSSVPVYLVFSYFVDVHDRSRLLCYLLGGSALFVLGLRVLLGTGTLVAYYAAFIFGGYFWEGMVIDVLFPSLVADYFTALEYKRYAWLLAIAMAIGGILGGSLTGLLANHFMTETLLLGLPFLYALVGLQVCHLSRTQAPPPQGDTAADEEEDTINGRESLKTLLSRFKRYPIVALLMLSTLLQVILSTIAEFQYLDIYTQTFPNEQALTQFISYLAVVFSLLEITVLYYVTRPLIRWLGIPRMNLLYPLATLLSFGGLAFNLGLPAAIALDFNTDTLDKSVEEPVYTLNYNALPHTLIGQVRALTDGLFYSLGMAIAGSLLWSFHVAPNSPQIIGLSLGLSSLFIALHYRLGQRYPQSLQALLQNRFNLTQDQLANGRRSLPDWANSFLVRTLSPLICILLRGSHTPRQRKLRKMTTDLAKPGDQRFANLALVELNHTDPQVVINAIQVLGQIRICYLMPSVAAQLEHARKSVRTAAAATLASYGEPSLALTQDYLMSQRPEVVDTAISAIGQVRTRRAADILYRHLKPEYKFLAKRSMSDRRPATKRGQPTQLQRPELDNYYRRLVHQVLLILSSLEGEDMLIPICQGLQDSDMRIRAYALELLVSIRHRRFVLPILFLLEDSIQSSPEQFNGVFAAVLDKL